MKFRKKAQFMPILQAVFSIIIFVAVLILLTNRFSQFPAVNEIPAQLSTVETTTKLYEQTQESLMTQSLLDYDDGFTKATTRHLWHKLTGTASVECYTEFKTVLKKDCVGELSSLYEAGLQQFMVTQLLSEYDVQVLALFTENELKHSVQITEYSPIHKVQIKDTRLDSSFGSSFWSMIKSNTGYDEHDFTYEDAQQKEFETLPDPFMPLAYAYTKALHISLPFSEQMNALFEIESSYDSLRATTVTYFQPIINSQSNRDQWALFLESPVVGLEIPQKEYLAASLKTELESKHPFLMDAEYTVSITKDAAIMTFTDYELEVELTY